MNNTVINVTDTVPACCLEGVGFESGLRFILEKLKQYLQLVFLAHKTNRKRVRNARACKKAQLITQLGLWKNSVDINNRIRKLAMTTFSRFLASCKFHVA